MDSDRLLESPLDGEVEFVVIGGVAAVLHGSTVLTRDLDICIPTGSGSFLKLQAALKHLNCLGHVQGIGEFADVLRASQPVAIGRRAVSVLGLDGLIQAKEAIGRPRDVETVVQLKAIRERRLRDGDIPK